MGFLGGPSAEQVRENPELGRKWGHQLTWKMGIMFAGLVAAVVIIWVISASSGSDEKNKGAGSNQVLSRTGLRTRACYNTETKCTPTKDCRGATGKVTSATAIAPDGDICCTFKCEDDYLPIRPCLASETVCSRGQSCRMGDNVTMPEAFTETGMSCCKFGCNTGDIPVRACNMGSEVVCPAGSYCFDFSGNVSVPNAKMSNGNSCCRANGTSNVCVPSNTTA